MLNTSTTPAASGTVDDGAGGSEPAHGIGAATAPADLAQNTTACQEAKQTAFVLRPPQRQDGHAIHRLISECPPLDLNSVYTYLLLSEHFRSTCIVAMQQDRLAGFVSGYRVPERDDVLFVWQVAVHERARGNGLGQRMLRALLDRPQLRAIRFIETTVGPDNKASRSMFRTFAQGLQTQLCEQAFFGADLFGPQAHDDEHLLRIGPVFLKDNTQDDNNES